MRPRIGVGAFLLSVASFTLAGIVNHTIDDTYGDSQTLQLPTYLPAVDVWADQTCGGCAIQPATSKAFKNTYTAATYHPGLQNISISMDFEGTAIYVYFILANNHGDDITTITMANFTIDGKMVGTFAHAPDYTANDILFNQLVFSKTDLPNGNHKLVISISDIDFKVFVNFDYAIYTVDSTIPSPSSASTQYFTSSSAFLPTSSRPAIDTDTSQCNSDTNSTPIGSIVGGIVGGIALIGAVVGILFWRSRREWHIQTNRNDPEPRNQDMGNVSAALLTPFVVDSPDSKGGTSPGSSHISSLRSKASNNNISDTHQGSHNESIWSSLGNGTSTSTQEHNCRACQRELNRQSVAANQELNQPRGVLYIQQALNVNGERNEKADSIVGGDDEMNRIQEQMQAMQAQIESLQSQLRNAQPQGLLNEPPPGYAP
ncbi:hypothetical protein BDQ17DRAFT_1419087 [Cyathus striatus]|nr:hypothetical protein BDQ17DRAFT_1419087 [Cyathus striatus]